MSSPTRYSVWEAWEMNRSQPGRTKLNGIRRTLTSKTWIASMVCRRSSSAKYSQDLQRWTSSKRWKNTVWTWAVQRQDHLHVNAQRHCMGRTKKHRKVWKKSVTVANCARRFPRGLWSFLGPGTEKKWYGNYSDIPDGDWDRTAERMMLNFAESSHPIFRATSTLERGEWRSKEKRKNSSHFKSSDENIELILRTVISVNQLSIYGAAPDLCKELSEDSRASGKPDAYEYLETMEITTAPPVADPHTVAEPQGNLLQDYERKFEQLLEDQTLSKLCPDAGLKFFWKKTILHYTWWRKTRWNEESMSWVFIASRWNIIPSKRVDNRKHEDRPGLGCKGLSSSRTSTVLKSWSNLCFETEQLHGFESWTELTNATETSETISLENAEKRATKETWCQSETTTEACRDTVFHFYPSTWMKMDRHQSWQISSRLFCGVKSHDPIPATWQISPSRRWWSSTIRWYHGRIQENFDGALHWSITDWISILAKGGGAKKRFQYCLNPNSSRHFLYFREIQGHSGGKKWYWVARHCSVTRGLHWVHLPRRECKCNEFNKQKWIDSRKKKLQKTKTISVLHCSEPDGRWPW